MNYRIITDEEKLKQFIDWLPDLKEDETFYLCLFSRTKYMKGLSNMPHIRSDKAQLKRFTSNKERLFEKIQQLECPIGSYKLRGQEIPQESIALYITINPRSFIKANKSSLNKLLTLALQPYNGYNPHQEVMSEIQKAKSRSVFVTFDFDVGKIHFTDIRRFVCNCVNKEAIQWIETRGGYHLTIRVESVVEEHKRSWYNNIKKVLNEYSSDNDNAGDIMCPVVGTYQGGFTPTFL